MTTNSVGLRSEFTQADAIFVSITQQAMINFSNFASLFDIAINFDTPRKVQGGNRPFKVA